MLAATEEVVIDNQVRDQVISVTPRLKSLLPGPVCKCVCVSLPAAVSLVNFATFHKAELL